MSDEEWRPVVGWEGLYEVSSLGRVRSLDRIVENRLTGGTSRKRGRVLKLQTIKSGYVKVGLSGRGSNVRRTVHRLVCRAFHGPPPEGRSFVLHGDGDPGNNEATNLRWGSNSDNTHDSVAHGTHHLARREKCVNGHSLAGVESRPGRGRICAKCHLERVKRTYQGGLSEGDPRHGSNNGYANCGCRCPSCLQARRQYLAGRKK